MPTRTALTLRTLLGLAAVTLLTGAVVVSCEGDPPDASSDGGGDSDRPASLAFGIWQPDSAYSSECPASVHDKYYVVGPDGKRYPTWHAPTALDDSGNVCSFGHEHGDNPARSAMWDDLRRHFAWDANGNGAIDESEWNNAATGIPFGYAPEQLADGGGGTRIHQHAAYRIHLTNSEPRDRLVNGSAQTQSLFCHQLVAFNQDAFGADAYASNAHELLYAIDCSGGSVASTYAPKLIVSVLARYGSPALFDAGPPDGATVQRIGGVPVPVNSPAPEAAASGETVARRMVPDDARVYDNALVAFGATSDLTAALRERWDAVVVLRDQQGAELARFNPGLEVTRATRYFDPLRGAALARALDACYGGLDASGNFVSDPALAGTAVRIVRGTTECPTPSGPATPLAQRVNYADGVSPFKACERSVIWRDLRLTNGTGPADLYTDAWGQGGRNARFAGGVKQYVKAVDTTGSGIVLAPLTLPANAPDCSAGSGVHVPR